jgi:hypothetical protein
MINKIMKVLPVIHILNEEQAYGQAKLIMESGADGFWLINHNGNDLLTLALATRFEEIYKNSIIGVNLLSYSADVALTKVITYGIKYLWLDSAGIHSESFKVERLESQKNLCLEGGVTIFGGTAFKYQPYDPNPATAAKQAKAYGLIATTSGVGTGHAADLDKIKSMSLAVDGDLAIASGLTLDNLHEYHPYIEYALVATGLSKDEYHFNQEKLVNFINKAKQLNLAITN